MENPKSKGLVAHQWQRLRSRTIWSWAGCMDAWTNEPSFRSWIFANIASIGLTFALPISAAEQLVIIVLGLLVLVAELFNTAIERLTDLVTQEHHELAGQAKDAGSAGVFVMALAAGFAWIYALFGLLY